MRKPKVIASGVLRLGSFGDQYRRLSAIYQRINQVVSEYRPDELAIESPFFGKNVQSMLKLGRAQGVAITVALSRGLLVTEYSPRKIKQVIAGNGNASKEQVARMLPHLVEMLSVVETHDESDALATALCHHIERHRVIPGTHALKASRPSAKPKSKKAGWSDFLSKNPDRLG